MNTYGNALHVLDALGDPTRRAVLELVARRPQAVGEVAGQLPVSRPAVSQHLRVLRNAGLVRSTQEVTRHIYALDRRGIAAVRAYLDRFWDESLAAYATTVEQDEHAPDEQLPDEQLPDRDPWRTDP